jgi:nitrite reductase (cytochrome c-552)
MKKIHKAKFADNDPHPLRMPLWLGIGLAGLLAIAIIVLGLLSVSIMERRWEAQRPMMVVTPIGQWESDNAKWGQNYPRQYEAYLKTRITDTQTKFGGSVPRDYLQEFPAQVILFAGYGFSKEYLQARGHYYALEDVTNTKRLAQPFQAATCWTCKSSDVPRVMNEMGVAEFYAANFHDLKGEMTHAIGCLDCHDPETMKLRISRPADRRPCGTGQRHHTMPPSGNALVGLCSVPCRILLRQRTEKLTDSALARRFGCGGNDRIL